jgi:hypothetical protein
MKKLTLTAFTALSLTTAIGPIASVHAKAAPSALEQAVHANARIMHGGAIPGDSVPFPAFEHTDISAADILNRQELYHVNPSVVPTAPGYEIAKARNEIVAHGADHHAVGTHIVRSAHTHFVHQVGNTVVSKSVSEPVASSSRS